MKELLEDGYIKSDYVCTWKDGRVIEPNYLTRTFHKMISKSDLPTIRLHDLRHPYVKLTTKKFATFFENFRATA